MAYFTLKIIFNLTTIRGKITNNMEYKPAFSNPQLYSQFPDILFIPTIKLTKKMFADSNLGEDDIKKIFLLRFLMNNLYLGLKTY